MRRIANARSRVQSRLVFGSLSFGNPKLQWRIQNFPQVGGANICRGGSRIPRRRGANPNFPKNCIKLRKFWSVGAPLGSTTDKILPNFSKNCMKLKEGVSVQGRPCRDTPPRIRKTGGTHPGMLLCFICVLFQDHLMATQRKFYCTYVFSLPIFVGRRKECSLFIFRVR